jgi:hypothetical protein
MGRHCYRWKRTAVVVKGFGCRPVVTYPAVLGAAPETLHLTCRCLGDRVTARLGGFLPFLICSARDAHGSKAVIGGLKPRPPALRPFQLYRWRAEGQRDILVHEGLPLLEAEEHRMDVATWLRGLGLERYEQAFLDNEIDEGVLPSLTAEDLKDLGVTLVGHRRRLLEAVAALGAVSPAATVTAAPSAPPAPRADAERRQLTVMFCDLVGSTALSTRHDPEDLRELVGDYHRAVAETVGRFDGFVAKYMGDGVLIYFGYPQAHEDDAERAVRAGLAVIAAVGPAASTTLSGIGCMRKSTAMILGFARERSAPGANGCSGTRIRRWLESTMHWRWRNG